MKRPQLLKDFFFIFKFKIGIPMFPPNKTLYLFFKTCAKILHVVDFPLVPVITTDLEKFLVKKTISRSVIIFFYTFFKTFLFFDLFRLIPGLNTM